MSRPPDARTRLDKIDRPVAPEAQKIYVFGYGSLVDPSSFSRTVGRGEWRVEDFPLTTLRGYKRVWDVAMDNRLSLAGYKRYARADAADDFPALYVCFIDIAPDPAHRVVGAMAAVSEAEFECLAARERNYHAVDVTAAIQHPPLDGRVYTFIGSEEAKARFAAGRATNTLAINTAYATLIENAYRARGESAFDNFRQSTQTPEGIPRIALNSVRVPG